MPEMKMDEYTTHIEGKMVSFYHDQKSHKMLILMDHGEHVVTLAKGRAIIDFLKVLQKT